METGTNAIKSNGAHRPIPQKGVGSGNYKRTPEMIARMLKTRRKNAREARRAAKAPRKAPRQGAKPAPRKTHGKPAGGVSRAGAGTALAYLREASQRALALVTGGVPKAAAILGLIELAREDLGGQ